MFRIPNYYFYLIFRVTSDEIRMLADFKVIRGCNLKFQIVKDYTERDCKSPCLMCL